MSAKEYLLVVGSGSIAKRHINNLKEMFPDAFVICVSSSGRNIEPADVHADGVSPSIEAALAYPLKFAVIASPAPFHLEQAALLLKAKVPVLIEKPLANTLLQVEAFKPLLLENRDRIDIGYNLRYMPAAIRMKELLEEKRIGAVYSVQIEAGQYLPLWRPGTDYRNNVSAQSRLGGGVLLELSHELDYLVWLFGAFDRVFCVTKNTGYLEIDVEDAVSALFTREDGLTASIQMDFLQRKATRFCKVCGQFATLVWDLAENTICIYEDAQTKEYLYRDNSYERNQMYMDEIACFSERIRTGEKPKIEVEAAIYVMSMIEAMKNSALTGQVVDIGVN